MLHTKCLVCLYVLRIRASCVMDASGSSGTQEGNLAVFAKEEEFVSEDCATLLGLGSKLHCIADKALS